MNTVKIKAYAKVNLTLDVLGTEGGYHQLDSFVASLDLYDLIVVKKRKDPLIFVTMHGQGSESIPPEKNNAQKAGEKFVERFQTTGADITVYKNIPIGGGLGGSSADISGVLNGLSRLYGVDEPSVKTLADELGSDTGYMLTGGFARISGRGEKVERIAGKEKLHLFLLCPKTSVSSGECYKKYDERGRTYPPATNDALTAYLAGDFETLGKSLSNHLFESAKELNGDVAQAVSELSAFSPLGVSMTGSGSTAFALFENKEYCEWAKSRYEGKFRAIVAETVVPRIK